MRVIKVERINDEIRDFIDKKVDRFGFKEGSHLIYDGENMIGMFDYDLIHDYIKLNSIQIADEYRKKGYGTKVIDYLLQRYSGLYIIGDTTYSAIGFYQSLDNCRTVYNPHDGVFYFEIGGI